MTWQKEISLSTSGHRDIHDLTGEVAQMVEQSGISIGTVHVADVKPRRRTVVVTVTGD